MTYRLHKKIGEFLALAMIFALLSFGDAVAKLRIELKQVGPGITVSAAEVPLMSAVMKVRVDDAVTVIKKENLLIAENGSASKPVSVESPDSDGWQKVTWYTSLRGVLNTADFYVTVNDESQKATGYSDMTRIPQLRYVMNDIEGYVNEYTFDYTAPGGKTIEILNLVPVSNVLNDLGQEKMMSIDSVVLIHDNITYIWRGHVDNRSLPPIMANPGLRYAAWLEYTPDADEYYRSTMTAHYAGGLKEKVTLTGNSYPIKGDKRNLEFVYPTKAEHYTPCQEVTLKWKGTAPDLATQLSYSTNNGINWNKIASVYSSTYTWKVPNDLTDGLKFRISQEFKDSKVRKLVNRGTVVKKISYRNDGAKLLAADAKGQILEWDVAARKSDTEYEIGSSSGNTDIEPSGVAYTSETDTFAVSYHYPNKYPRQDSMAFFEVGNPAPIKTVNIETDFAVKKMMVDPSKSYVVMVSELGPRVLFYSARNGKYVRDMRFPYPVTDFVFSKDLPQAAASLSDGSLYIITLPDFNVEKILNFSDIPIITTINLSPNGKYLAVGCDAPKKTTLSGNKNEIHIIDIEKEYIVRTSRTTSSNPLGLEFSPTSSALLIGATAQPQISLWDLETPPQGTHFNGLSQLGGSLNDLAFSPAGTSIASAGSVGGELATSNFTYAETVECDSACVIELPELVFKGNNLPDQYLGHEEIITLSSGVRNVGLVPLYINDAAFINGIHFELLNMTIPDTLYPGESMDIEFAYTPKVVGELSDSLAFSACSNDIMMPFASKGLARNIKLFSEKIDLGELCVSHEEITEVRLLKNNDPVPLKINLIRSDEIGNPQFEIVRPLGDTLLQPGEELTVMIKFAPKEAGDIDYKLDIFHSGCPDYKRVVDIHGFGLGTICEFSHQDLRYVPEHNDRELTIINNSKNIVLINKVESEEAGVLTCMTTLPLEIPAFDQKTLIIHSNQVIDSEGTINIDAGPCEITYHLTYGPYIGTSVIDIPDTEADPRGNGSIPINFTNTSNKPYDGYRDFLAEFSINPRLFLPTSVSSDYGTGEIVRNEIVNDSRIVGIRVNGDFPESGELCRVNGVAGLAETDRSPITISDKSKFWGVNVETEYSSGSFILINVAEGRRILRTNALVVNMVAPNPVSESFEVKFKSAEAGKAEVKIFDNLGNAIKTSGMFSVKEGDNSLNMTIGNIPSGTYRVVVSRGLYRDSATIIIAR